MDRKKCAPDLSVTIKIKQYMISRRYIKSLVAIICVLAGIGTYAFTASGGIPGCVSSKVLTRTHYATPTFSEDGKSVAFAQYVYLYHPVIGICKFPDGGTDRPVKKSIRVYTMALDSYAPNLLTEISLPRTEPENIFGYNNFKMRGWTSESIVLTYGLDSSATAQRRSYSIQSGSGEWHELAEASHPLLTKHWSAGNFSPTDKTVWVTYESSVGIAVYRDGYHVDEKGNPYQSGVPQLVKILLSTNDLQRLEYYQQ